jgi:hypothetical protein
VGVTRTNGATRLGTAPGSSSCFELFSTVLFPFVVSYVFARPLGRDIGGRSNEKRDSLSRCCTPQLFAEIHHFAREMAVNVKQDPVVGVSLPKRKTVRQAPGQVYLTSMSPQYACSQALPKLVSANQKDLLPPMELMHYCSGALHP